MAVAAQSKNPERALMVYDLMRNDPEIYHLMQYGIEGEMYTLDENGRFARPDGFEDSVDGVSFNFWWGRNDNLEYKNAQLDWDAIDALYEVYNGVKIDYPYGQYIYDNSMIGPFMDNLSNVYNTYMPRIVFGMNDDPEALVAEFRAALKDAGIDMVMEEVQNQLNAVYAK